MIAKCIVAFLFLLIAVDARSQDQTAWKLTATMPVEIPAPGPVVFAVDGNTLAYWEMPGSVSKNSHIRVFKRQNEAAAWISEATLDSVPPHVLIGAIVLRSNFLAVGASGESFAGMTSAGTVQIFERDEHNIWRWRQKLVEPEPHELHYFGQGLAISGDFLAVGVSYLYPKPHMTAVEIYHHDQSTGQWSHTTTIATSGLDSPGWFLPIVSLSGTGLAIGAYDPSFVHIIRYDGSSSWVEEAKLPIDGGPGKLVLDGSRLAVLDNSANGNTVRVFVRNPDEWDLESSLVDEQGISSLDHFGRDLALNGNTMVMGADGSTVHQLQYAGELRVFSRSESTLKWSKVQVLNSEHPSDLVGFGGAIAFDGKTIVAAVEDKRSAHFSLLTYANTTRHLQTAPLNLAAVASGSDLPAPVILSPSGQIATQCPTYQWKAVAGATGYKVHLDFPSEKIVCTAQGLTWGPFKGDKLITAETSCASGICYLAHDKIPGFIRKTTDCSNAVVLRRWSVAAMADKIVGPDSPVASYGWDGSSVCSQTK